MDNIKVQMQSGHAYNRAHTAGSVSDFATMQEAENAVINDFSKSMANNSVKFTKNFAELSTTVNGKIWFIE